MQNPKEKPPKESKLVGFSRKGKGRSSLPARKSYLPQKPQAQSASLPPQPSEDTSSRQTFAIGDRVCISGVKTGRLLYFGQFDLGRGLWCGIELEEPVGKHDGEVGGVRYFTAKPSHGIFAPVDKVSLAADASETSVASGTRLKKPKLSFVLAPSSIPKLGRRISPVDADGIPGSLSGKSHGVTYLKRSIPKSITPPVDANKELGAVSSPLPPQSNDVNVPQILKSHAGSETTSRDSNRTLTLCTEGEDVQTQIIRCMEKRSQPEEFRTSEQDSKRPRFSQLPLSRLPNNGDRPPRTSSHQPDCEGTAVLNSTVVLSSKHAPVLSNQDTVGEDDGTFSPEVHRQLVAGGKQYLSLTFEAESEENGSANVPVTGVGNETVIIASNTGAGSDYSREEISELCSSLEFLKGDCLQGEHTRLGILKLDELDDELIRKSLLGEEGASLLSGLCNKDVAAECDQSRDDVYHKSNEDSPFNSDFLNELVTTDSVAADSHKAHSIASNENFSFSELAVTSTPLCVSNRGITKVEAAKEAMESSTPDLLIGKRVSDPAVGNFEDIRSNLDLTNNAYQKETDPEAEKKTSKDVDNPESESESDSQPVVDELEQPEPVAPAGTMTTSSADTHVIQGTSPGDNQRQASLVLLDPLKPESKPMTDSGIDNVMTASQEMVESQNLLNNGFASTGESDRLEEALNERNQLAADLIAGHSKTDRPMSLISSVTSVDTGYVPDTDSERGTLTTNSPLDWPGAPDNKLEKSLTELYTETFENYQEGMMKGVTGCLDKDVGSGMLASATDRDDAYLEDVQMETVCETRNEALEMGTGEEMSNSSSNDLTEVLVSKLVNSDQDTLCESSSDSKSKDESQEQGEQVMETASAMESQPSDNTYKMEVDGNKGDSSADNTKETESLSNSNEEKSQKESNAKGKKLKVPLKNEHKKPNIKVESKLVEYLKSTQPVKPKEDGGASSLKANKNLTNKRKTDSGKDSPKGKLSLNKSEEKCEDGEAKPRKERVKREREPPKVIKRSKPVSKWKGIMSTIEATKDASPKPKEKVKGHIESLFSQEPKPKQEVKKVESKLPKKRLDNYPKPDYSQVKSRLGMGPPKPSESTSRVRKDSTSSTGLVLHLDFPNSINGSINDSAASSARSSRSDISGLGSTDTKRSAKPVTNRASSLMKFERSQSAGSAPVDEAFMSPVKAMNEQNIQKSPRPKSEIKSSIPPLAPRRPSTARSSPARSSPAKSSGKTSEASTSKQTTKSASVSKHPTSTSHHNRNKNIKSKTPNYQKSLEAEKEKSVKAAEEISRLEALNESRTKEVAHLKMQVKSQLKAFDVMTTLVNYLSHELDAFSCPVIKEKLDRVLKELSETQIQLRHLQEHKNNLEEEIVSLNKQHEAVLASVNSEHAEQMTEAHNVLKAEHQKKLLKVKEKNTEEIDSLHDSHERHTKQLNITHREEIHSLQKKHENQMEELHCQHKDKEENITLQFESIKKSLLVKVRVLQEESDELHHKSQLAEQAFHRERDSSIQSALEPYKNLAQEIESLKSVLKMRNEDVRELRQQNHELKFQLEELPIEKEKTISLQQKVENLEAILNIKTEQEKTLSDKCQHLLKRLDKENKENKRISMHVEELEWRISESENDQGSMENVYRRVIATPIHGETREQKTKSWGSVSDTSLTPATVRRPGEPSDRKSKRWSTSLIPEAISQSTPKSTSPNSSSSISRSQDGSAFSACESSVSMIDPIDGPHGLPPPESIQRAIDFNVEKHEEDPVDFLG